MQGKSIISMSFLTMIYKICICVLLIFLQLYIVKPADAAVTGSRNVLVVPITWETDLQVESYASIKSRFMDSFQNYINPFYIENSYSKFNGFSVSVNNWVKVPIQSSCNTIDIKNQVYNSLITSGVNVSSYSLIIYYIKGNAPCTNFYASYYGETHSITYIGTIEPTGKTIIRSEVLTHEIGHYLGVDHANSLRCSINNIFVSFSAQPSQCIFKHYGNYIDIMGSTKGHFNASKNDQLGWFGPTQIKRITSASSGVYVLSKFETGNSGYKAIAVTKDNLTFYVEFRSLTGFDIGTNLAIPGMNPGNSVQVNLVTPQIYTSTSGSTCGINCNSYSYLIDMQPETDAFSNTKDASLRVGQTFNSNTGITIQLLQVVSGYAFVKITR